MSDILSIAQGDASQPFPKAAEAGLTYVNSYTSAFYVRIRFRDGIGLIKSVGEIFAKDGVSIYSILQNPIKDPTDAQFVVLTDAGGCQLRQEVVCRFGGAGLVPRRGLLHAGARKYGDRARSSCEHRSGVGRRRGELGVRNREVSQ